jgi:hypothetical protein
MRRIGQHYVSGTPVAAAVTADGDAVKAVISCDNHGDNTVFFTLRPTEDGAYAHQFLAQQAPSILDAATFAGGALIGATRAGDVTIMTGDAGVAASAPQDGFASGTITSLHTLSDGVVAATTTEGEIVLLDTDDLKARAPPAKVAPFGGLPFSAVCPVDQGQMLVTCRNTLALVDVRAPMDAVKVWRWNPAEELSAVATSGPSILAGTSEGNAVLFDWRTESHAVGHAVCDAGSSITSVACVREGAFVTQASSSALRLWDMHHGMSQPRPAFHPDAQDLCPSLGAPGAGVSLAVSKSTGVLFATDDSGMIDIFGL